MKKRMLAVLLLIICVMPINGCAFDKFTKSGNTNKNEDLLIIGIDSEYEPYTYKNENGELTGIDIEISKEVCNRLGITPIYKAIQWDLKDEYLKNGTIDCVWSCFSYTGREDKYQWAGPYFYSRQVVVVRNDSDIYHLSDLEGKLVSVMSSTKPESIFLDKLYDYIPDIKNLYCFKNLEYAFVAMRKGYTDAVSGHETAIKICMDSDEENYRILDEALLKVQIGVAFDKDSTNQPVDDVSNVLKDMKEDGTIDKIVSKYGLEPDKVVRGK